MNSSKSIEKQSESKLEKKLESLVRKALYTHNICTSSPIGIALSGGKDSLTMLYLLKKISGKGFPELKFIAFYVEGTYSCGPSITKHHITSFCKEIDVPLITLSSSVDIKNIQCYSCARERRSLIFKKAHALGCKEIAFGHHKDDVLETLLLNLLHKGEFASQLPNIYMHNYNISIVRPLYYVSEKEIIRFAKYKNFFRFSCQCPIGKNSKRNTVKNILKNLTDEFPNTKTNLFHALNLYGSDKSLRKKTLPII